MTPDPTLTGLHARISALRAEADALGERDLAIALDAARNWIERRMQPASALPPQHREH